MAALPLIPTGIGPVAQQPADPGAVVDFAGWLANSSPAVIFIVFIIALVSGKLVLPREVSDRDKRIAELVRERDEYKDIAFKAVGLGERVVSVAEERGRH